MPEMKKTLLGLIIILNVISLGAQDIHYSQFYNSPLNFNPANTGVFNGDKRFNLSYRSQWRSVPVPWTTYSGSFDKKFYPKGDSDNFFSGGLLFNYDTQGNVTSLSLANLNLTGSYTVVINQNNLFTIGALLGYGNRGFDNSSLTWDRQWNGTTFDPTINSGEPANVDRINFFDTGLGLNYRWQSSKRTKLDLGVGGVHLIEPKVAFLADDNIKLPRRFTLSGVGSFQVAKSFDIQLNALAQFQNEYNELVFGGLGKIYVNQQRGRELEFHVGAGYRTSNSIFPIVAIQYKNFYVGLNYDLNMSDFNNNRLDRPTSFEMHFNYIITDVKPFRKVKVCPIY
jgi:type IX secretion system PorP/SprF family membrane protein